MNCIKCGRELEEGQVFCEECLEVMERDPVKITAPVVIPSQPVKKPNYRRPVVNPEEEVKRLLYVNQNLIMALVLVSIAAVLFAFLAYEKEFWEVVDNLGRNYHVMETATGG